MVSTCPTCRRQVTHEDHLFEVACQCGSRFNPFATAEDLPPMEPSMGGGESASEPDDFSESSSVFSELVNFGEGLDALPEAGSVEPISEAPVVGETPAKSAKAVATSAGVEGSIILVAADSVEAHKIESHLGLISSSAEIDPSQDDPLNQLFANLSAKAESLGANAVISLKWWLSPDGTRAIAAGSAVRCLKCE